MQALKTPRIRKMEVENVNLSRFGVFFNVKCLYITLMKRSSGR